ncbi:type IV pilus assembly protein PilY1 [Tahibacter aquaticus]|uniref:Type IV pilus assembly protein PilY1 n=1 Tax=Tahibacter aquaticus TaxID=520092 RepID=A0A4R6YWB4_9GAMM|nr:PilC/PilY family type IV pilus protein [Tahibacter aquaticus]TDR43108.1 type IV pilus assembly protein PilY1 [Tahibacter aquaticus]
MSLTKFLRSPFLAAAVAALTLGAGLSGAPATAGTVDLGTAPPDLSSAVNPNVIVTFDDSGSMGATALPDDIADEYGYRYYYDSKWNKMYFDPLKDYPPPMRPDGINFPNSNFDAAWRDGICHNWSPSYCYNAGNTKNLGTRFYESFGNETATTNRPNALAADNRTIPSAFRPASGGAFWFECPNRNETNCVLKVVGTATDPKPAPPAPEVLVPIKQRFANWYSYYRTRNLMTRTALSRTFGGQTLDNKVRVIWQTINADFITSTPAIRGRQVQEMTSTWKTSFFNWMFEVTNNGGTPNRRATIEAAKVAERSLSGDNMNPYYYPPLVAGGSFRSLECRQNFHMLVTDGYWNEGDPTTPTPYVKQNSGVTLPDGKVYSVTDPLTTIYWNVAGTAYDSSISNIAFNYWARDLQPTLANKVPAYWADRTAAVTVPPNDPGSVPSVYWNPANDPATWQHVVQFMVALGIAGNLNYPTDYNALRTGTLAWPTPSNNSKPALDDTWHAAVNSRGQYFSADNPTVLVDKLTEILTSILTRRGASTTPAVSTGVLTTTTAGYVAGYDSADWSGYLMAQNIDEFGNLLSTVNWDAGCKLTGGPCPSTGSSANTPAKDPSSRVIVTSSGTLNSGKPFRWTSLNAVQQANLNGVDARGSERLNFLRGDRTSENLTTNPLRKRGSVLGPVVNGQPRYYGPVETLYDDLWPAGAPEMGLPFKSFSKYRTESLTRKERIFLAANDGMLHAFDKDGNEAWAYIPSTLFTNGKLRQLTAQNSGLVPTVDDRPIIGDAYIRGKWRSILIGSLRFGGRGIYALDISDAAATESEGGVAGKVLWEFNALNADGTTNPDAANLGYTYDSANLARLANGKWVVLISSGYFPKTGPDSTIAPAIANQTSLFVIDLDTGALIRELRTPAAVTSYGLSGPEVVNYNRGRDTNIDSFAVAGDLAGNLWRFDLEKPNPADWTVTLMFQTYDGVAANIGKQPISVTPIAFSDAPRGPAKSILLFGTGKYLGDEDRLATGTPQQYLYGIRDRGPGMSRTTLTQLVNQTMLNEPNNRRSVTKNPMLDTQEGWRINLPTLGERNVVTLTPIFANGFAVFSTVIPAGDNPCDPARTGAIIVVDSRNGGPPGTLLDSAFGGSPGAGKAFAGVVVANPPAAGQLGAVNRLGGGSLILPGITPVGGGPPVELNVVPVWRRGSWREALDFTE